MQSFLCLRKMHIVTSFSIRYANKDIQFLWAKSAHSDAIFNALHGARFARKIFYNHTCRWMFHSLSHAFFVFKCYSHLRNSLLHGARFARKVFFDHTCRSMFLSLSDALFVLRCYSNLLNHTCRWMFLLFSDDLFVLTCYSDFRISLLHGARFARNIFLNHTCHWMFHLLSHASFVFGCYSGL